MCAVLPSQLWRSLAGSVVRSFVRSLACHSRRTKIHYTLYSSAPNTWAVDWISIAVTAPANNIKSQLFFLGPVSNAFVRSLEQLTAFAVRVIRYPDDAGNFFFSSLSSFLRDWYCVLCNSHCRRIISSNRCGAPGSRGWHAHCRPLLFAFVGFFRLFYHRRCLIWYWITPVWRLRTCRIEMVIMNRNHNRIASTNQFHSLLFAFGFAFNGLILNWICIGRTWCVGDLIGGCDSHLTVSIWRSIIIYQDLKMFLF